MQSHYSLPEQREKETADTDVACGVAAQTVNAFCKRTGLSG